ncbi:WEB family protein At3g51220-like [Zingiber officinale]|nr:WEB family protein At3g51220-like [Zingiber officinale]
MGSNGGEHQRGVGAMAEIDTSAPFASVKEAIMLFGEKVLVGEIYANRLNQFHASTASKNDHERTRLTSVIAELEEAKHKLDKANEERSQLKCYLSSLHAELENTKLELAQLKAEDDHEKRIKDIEVEIEVENVNNHSVEFQKRRCVTFADPPVVLEEQVLLERQGSVMKKKNKKKKQQLLPLIAGLFAKKKEQQYD